MSEHDTIRDLQSWLDGELPESKRAEVEAVVAADAELAAMAGELRRVREAMRRNELPRSTPSPRELYWSGIEASIRRGEARRGPAGLGLAGWVRRFLPIAGVAAVALLMVWRSGLDPELGGGEGAARELLTETPAEEMVSVSFRSESEGMTVVWVQGVDLH